MKDKCGPVVFKAVTKNRGKLTALIVNCNEPACHHSIPIHL